MIISLHYIFNWGMMGRGLLSALENGRRAES